MNTFGSDDGQCAELDEMIELERRKCIPQPEGHKCSENTLLVYTRSCRPTKYILKPALAPSRSRGSNYYSLNLNYAQLSFLCVHVYYMVWKVYLIHWDTEWVENEGKNGAGRAGRNEIKEYY